MSLDAEPMPIVLVASGTSTTASATYRRIEAECRRRFPEHAIHLAYSSRAIRKRVREKTGQSLATPEGVFDQLIRAGCQQAVVQALHLICGIEFHYLAWRAAQSTLDIHLGLPLLAQPEDFDAVLDWIATVRPPSAKDALVLVGHGTDHPAWMSYALLDQRIRSRFGESVFLGLVKGDPAPSALAARLKAAGCRQVHLRPFMLVAGAHFMQDISGDRPTSWQSHLQAQGLTVVPHNEGLGTHPAALAIFGRHIRAAMADRPLKLE
ncbi:MAG: sirohydrochlorin cobaltochelatase [Desulfobacterales bacterium]